MTKATMAGEVGDVEQFRAKHPNEGLLAAVEGASADPATDDADITSPGWDASQMPKRGQMEEADETAGTDETDDTEDAQAKLLEQAESYVVANPLKALATAVVAGVMLGRML